MVKPKFTVHDPVEEGDSKLLKDWKECKCHLDPASYLAGYTLQFTGPIKVRETNPMLCLVIPVLIEKFGYTLDELLVASEQEVRESAVIYSKVLEFKRKEKDESASTD